jgi:hypothetical protein
MIIDIKEPMILVQDCEQNWYLIREDDKELFNTWDIEYRKLSLENGGLDFSNLEIDIFSLKIYKVDAEID